MPPCPPEPIPEPLRGLDNPSFARETILHRLPKIGRRTIEENDFPPEVTANLRRLVTEIPNGLIRDLDTPLAPDAALWEQYTRPYLGQNWLEVPWFFAECYFYMRILEATGYFQPGPSMGADPFARQKEASLAAALQGPRPVLQDLIDAYRPRLEEPPTRLGQAFGDLLYLDLTGNQVDLSRWPDADILANPTGRERILVDNTPQVARFLFGERTPARVDFLIDNTGFELVADLCLAGFLLHRQATLQVTFHLKSQPTFVSDATIADVHTTLDTLTRAAGLGMADFARRIQDYLQQGRLRLRTHPFWTSPLPMWEAPGSLLRELDQARLVVCKGDAHYRRLLGDRHWQPTTSFSRIVCYLDTHVLALRTLKSEVVAGLQPGQAEKAGAEDADWMTNGQWALVQWTGGEKPV